ncbi:oxytocin receptor-like [Macrobrachium rosenbergii]|uniref:oxytocin receptor-like n=1 Tax=Macrobrachium rosenbergii TaxID=79674 RepID=UPI0034D3A690
MNVTDHLILSTILPDGIPDLVDSKEAGSGHIGDEATNMEELGSHLGYNDSMLFDELNNFVKESKAVGGDGLMEEVIIDARNPSLAVVEIIVLVFILIVAIVGNIFVLIALWRHSLFQPMSRCYLFMLHLSLADLLVALLNILPQLIWDITYRFRGSDLLCRLVKYAQVFVLYVSTYMLVFMAIDRARAVQGNGRGSLRSARLMIVGAWVLGLILAVPQIMLFAMREAEPGIQDCWVVFEMVSERIYVTWFVVSIFLLPLTIIAVCYGYICWAVWCSVKPNKQKFNFPKKCHSCLHRHSEKEEDEGKLGIELQSIANMRHPRPIIPQAPVAKVSAAKMKTIRMTLTVVLAFTGCWAPFSIAQLMTVYNRPDDLSTLNPVTVVCMLLASLNSCTNPWIYLYFSGTLLNQLRVVLGLGPSRSHDNISIGDEEHRGQRNDESKHPITHSNMV